MLAASNIVKHHGPQRVLAGATLVVPPHARIGLVGPNGVGKSTLLRILAGLEEPDSGTVRRSGSVGYLPQMTSCHLQGETLLESLARRTGVDDAARAMDALTARLGAEPELAADYGAALERFLALGGADLEARARETCASLGLPVERLHAPLGALSGGEAARAALAGILLARFDTLLLDEPTNDLDLPGLETLEGFVTGFSGAIVVVSHDRAFLDRCVTRVVELDEGSRRTIEYAGGWSEYAAERARARARHYDRWESYVDEKARVEEQARRMQRWEERGYGQGRKKKKSKDVKKAYGKKLDRLERIDKPFEPWELRLDLDAAGRAGDTVLALRGAVVERGSFRIGPVDLELFRGDRLALVGPNGSGKTTLLEALLGRLPLVAGRRTVGTGVVVGELAQERTAFAGGTPLLEAFVDASGLDAESARTLLAKFDLGADHVLRRAGSLSPGERTRATLAMLSARRVNCLLLDEPTNHLDLEAIEQLEQGLAGYEGTVVLVSHDRRFLEAVVPTRSLELTTGPERPSRRPRAAAGSQRRP
jgi:ATPase subunit of ABC transporter with duplicated ATPase domains